MNDMLQKSKNVANNVVNENSQDLTEQWKKGELPEGWYWVKDDDGQIKLAEYSVYCIDRETNETEYDWSCLYEIEQVLAPVPTYEEWHLMQADNKRLKHDVGNLGYKIKNQRHEIENRLKEIEKLKELLKKVKDYLPEFETPMNILAKIDEALK